MKDVSIIGLKNGTILAGQFDGKGGVLHPVMLKTGMTSGGFQINVGPFPTAIIWLTDQLKDYTCFISDDEIRFKVPAPQRLLDEYKTAVGQSYLGIELATSADVAAVNKSQKDSELIIAKK